jgi:hypothetical protein
MTNTTAKPAATVTARNISRPQIIGWGVVDQANGGLHVGEPFPAGSSGERDACSAMRRLNQNGLLTRYAVDAILA